MGKLRFLWVGLLITGCADKAEPAFKECIALEAKGQLEAALDACGRAVSLDENSKAGAEAHIKQAQIGTKIIDDKAKAQKEAAAQAAATALASCKSGKWTTFCELNGQPSGGLLKPGTKAKCQEDASGFESMGMKCAPCKCADDVTGAIVE